jgi:hypothetical protein
MQLKMNRKADERCQALICASRRVFTEHAAVDASTAAAGDGLTPTRPGPSPVSPPSVPLVCSGGFSRVLRAQYDP